MTEERSCSFWILYSVFLVFLYSLFFFSYFGYVDGLSWLILYMSNDPSPVT